MNCWAKSFAVPVVEPIEGVFANLVGRHLRFAKGLPNLFDLLLFPGVLDRHAFICPYPLWIRFKWSIDLACDLFRGDRLRLREEIVLGLVSLDYVGVKLIQERRHWPAMHRHLIESFLVDLGFQFHAIFRCVPWQIAHVFAAEVAVTDEVIVLRVEVYLCIYRIEA